MVAVCDYRKLLDARKDVGVIVNGTPDHWHTAINIAACHLANIAMHEGRKTRWDAQREEIVGDPEASQSPYLRRPQRKPYAFDV